MDRFSVEVIPPRWNEQNLRKVADQCEKESGLKPLAIVADLGTDEGVEKTAKETIDHFGRLDVLVNNVGVGARTRILETDMATFDEVFNIDVRVPTKLPQFVSEKKSTRPSDQRWLRVIVLVYLDIVRPARSLALDIYGKKCSYNPGEVSPIGIAVLSRKRLYFR
ncbi:unnamed protein product [Arctia plantaginis]|uniref:Uncharacterized protein n=1 Tax=Arctia plantaginis TaxID=874455 RepID=A0A8S1A112_ARCPL|nr:unnamed protein product [Arctia plantaginis]